jgi:hypothetical protein
MRRKQQQSSRASNNTVSSGYFFEVSVDTEAGRCLQQGKTNWCRQADAKAGPIPALCQGFLWAADSAGTKWRAGCSRHLVSLDKSLPGIPGGPEGVRISRRTTAASGLRLGLLLSIEVTK